VLQVASPEPCISRAQVDVDVVGWFVSRQRPDLVAGRKRVLANWVQHALGKGCGCISESLEFFIAL